MLFSLTQHSKTSDAKLIVRSDKRREYLADRRETKLTDHENKSLASLIYSIELSFLFGFKTDIQLSFRVLSHANV